MFSQNHTTLRTLFFTSIGIFLFFIFLAYRIGVNDYINDSILFLLLVTILYATSRTLAITPFIYTLLLFAFILHNLGMFGFYNISPIFLQWDHVTHFFGEFAVAVLIYNYMHSRGLLTVDRKHRLVVIALIILASLGIGVFVEFFEFAGYFIVGDGLGIFGHGKGDIVTEFIDSEWFNTLFDLIYNLIGTLCGVLFCLFFYNKRSPKNP